MNKLLETVLDVLGFAQRFKKPDGASNYPSERDLKPDKLKIALSCSIKKLEGKRN